MCRWCQISEKFGSKIINRWNAVDIVGHLLWPIWDEVVQASFLRAAQVSKLLSESSPKNVTQGGQLSIFKSMHYAKVVEICILKCPTLTNYFSVVFHPGCPKFCAELCKLPKNKEKKKKRKIRRGKREKNAKKIKGVFANVKTGLKRIVGVNATIFALCIFFANTP